MASVNDKVTDTRNAARPVTTTVASPRVASGTSLSCASLTGWPTASKVHFVTYQVDSNNLPVSGTQLDCEGIVSGSTIGSITVNDGNDIGNSIGDKVEMLPTAKWGQDLSDAITNEHTRTGAHSAITATSVTSTGNIQSATALISDVVSEKTGAAGVTVDGLQIKDAKLNTNNSVVTANITDDAVTSAKLINGLVYRRQGGDATNWVTSGSTTFDVSGSNVKIQGGAAFIGAANTIVTFPVAFTGPPLIVATASSSVSKAVYIVIASQTTSTFAVSCIDAAGNTATTEFINWIAMGI